jgi:iron-sulfur cluster assembly protein
MEVLLDLAPIHFTPSSIAELENICKAEGTLDGKKLRIGVKNGGCAGFSYIMEFENETENDLHYMAGTVEIITDKDQVQYISGMTLDYENGLNNRGFMYNNPKAKTTCGCGTSFS